MPQRICCIASCKSSISEGAVLHAFPNPATNYNKFLAWVKTAGLMDEEPIHVYRNRRICRLHFENVFHYPQNRLSNMAIPTLLLPAAPEHEAIEGPVPAAVDEQQQPSTSTTNICCEPVKSARPDYIPLNKPPSDTIKRTYKTASLSRRALQSTICQDPDPLPKDEQQPCTSKGIPEDLLLKRPVQTALNLNKRSTRNSNKGILMKSLQLNTQENLDFYKLIVKTQAELKRCKKTKKGLSQKLKVAKKFTRAEAFKVITTGLSPAAKTFFEMQIRQCGKHPKGHRFTMDEKILALALYKPSPKAYRLLSKICLLPKKSTLNKLVSKVYLKPGPNEIIFEHLKKRVAKMPPKYRYCTLIFDEMAISANVSYDKHSDSIKGFCDDGVNRTKHFADHVLVFMVRGILKKFKQPIAYSFCTGTTKSGSLKIQLVNAIKKIMETGLKVVSTTCDQGSTNMAAINALIADTRAEHMREGIEFKGGYFKIGECDIYPIYDPPHLIKGVRNNLLTKNLEFVLDGKKRTAKWSHLQALHNQGYHGLRLVPKLTARHVHPQLIPKMKVKHCTEVFSRTVSVAMGFAAESGRIPRESTDTAELLLFFDQLFDSVNGNYSKIVNGKIYRSAVSPKSPHHKLWYKSLEVLKTMKFVGGVRAVPSISSWIKTIQAFQQITKKLNGVGIRSLLLRNFNQDPLENFFGAIRAHGQRNVMPTSSAFESSYKALLINNLVSPKSVGANCESDDGFCLQNLTYFLNQNIEKPADPQHVQLKYEHLSIDLPNVDNLLKSESPVDIEKCAAAAYCSGWIIRTTYKVLGTHSCVQCKNDLEGDSEEPFSRFITLKKSSNQCILHYPSKELLQCLILIENIVDEILKTTCELVQIAKYIELVVTSLISVNFITCETHQEVVKKHIINKAISLVLHDWCKDVNNLLCGKNADFNHHDPIKESAYKYFITHKTKNKRS